MPRKLVGTKHMHASTVYIPLRPTNWNIAPNSPFAAFEFNDLQEQVKYTNGAGDICELYLTKGMPGPAWQYHDLTDSTTPPVARESGIAAFVSDYNSQQHVLYNSSTSPNDLQEFLNSNGWVRPPYDLTAKAGAPTPKSGRPLTGYETPWNQQHHVDFIDDEGYVHELWFDMNEANPKWHDENLWDDLSLKPPQRVKAVNLVGYVTTYNNQQHVVYIGEDQNIYEYIYDTQWHLNQLPSSPAARNSALFGYVTTWTNPPQQHIIFFNIIPQVSELVLSQGNYKWQENNLNNRAKISSILASPSSGLTGYQTSNSQQHVDFVDANNRLWELLNTGSPDFSWTAFCLTDIATDINSNRVPHVASGSHLVGYETTNWNYLQHVIYATVNNEVYELYFYNKWYGNNLTKNALY
jgi:hypothetical protein